mmetsp:Transcript_42231/g.76541  ORF Transcript_42231/g.76541 Transcript_42231/m.76541 type:complete len:206 (+) Transcript_42231:116-733(+)
MAFQAPAELRSDRRIALSMVAEDGLEIAWVAAELTRDREIALAAVMQNGCALQYTVELSSDDEVVRTAVSQNGLALQYAAEELRQNREIVLVALSQNPLALLYAADTLLDDDSFAVEARQIYFLFKVIALSGRSCTVPLNPLLGRQSKQCLLRESCNKLGIDYTGYEELVYGCKSVPESVDISLWPGSPCLGRVLEYQLVRSVPL